MNAAPTQPERPEPAGTQPARVGGAASGFPAFARLIALILAGLCAVIHPAFSRSPRNRALSNPLRAYLTRIAHRLVRLADRLADGWQPRPRRPARPRPGPRPHNRASLPRGRAWVARAGGYHACGYASQLNHLLARPEAAAFIAAAPSIARLLRPLCHQLGLDPALLALPRRPRAPRQPTPAPRTPRQRAPRPPPPTQWPSGEICPLPPAPNWMCLQPYIAKKSA